LSDRDVLNSMYAQAIMRELRSKFEAFNMLGIQLRSKDWFWQEYHIPHILNFIFDWKDCKLVSLSKLGR
jgi:hypothetical protein